ncbi:integral membrane protein [Marssonina coronariae]|uniref:Integral membrane protein n=1 Tax=Diplocarpon coronariae TaxID=2795749 RepID=A0A218YTU7_9HELO|nr:integral membrane protein [Marssonina coronariae]
MQTRHHSRQAGTGHSSFDKTLQSNKTRRLVIEGAKCVRTPSGHSKSELAYPPSSPTQHRSSPGRILQRMCTELAWRDMSWMVGVTFAIGSAFFVANGFLLLLPQIAPSTTFPSQIYWTGMTGLVGGLVFIIGGFAGVLEALNLNRAGQVIVTQGVNAVNDSETSDSEKCGDEEALRHNAPFRDSANRLPLRQTAPSSISPKSSWTPSATLPAQYGTPAFLFWPNTPELRSIFFRDVCFVAAVIQSIGTFVFMVAIITGYPGVIDLTNIPLFYLSNLFPATLGGVLFTMASTMQMIHTQPTWYTALPLAVEWHVCFWNVVGSIGFTLAGALPFLGTTEGNIQASAASLWGSAAFQLGAMLQWYVSIKNRP